MTIKYGSEVVQLDVTFVPALLKLNSERFTLIYYIQGKKSLDYIKFTCGTLQLNTILSAICVPLIA
jgi:hypothetical protein